MKNVLFAMSTDVSNTTVVTVSVGLVARIGVLLGEHRRCSVMAVKYPSAVTLKI